MRNEKGQFVKGGTPHNKMEDIDHGSWTMYNRGCKCQPCKDAFAQYYADRQGRITVKERRQLPCSVCGEGERLTGSTECRSCRNEKSRIRMNTKNRPDSYEEKLVLQNGLCAICKKYETSTYRGKIKELAADHNHLTGMWRGLLCAKCNTALGLFDDDPELLEAAINYLRSWEEK